MALPNVNATGVPINQAVMAYNPTRLEMPALAQNLGVWLRREDSQDFCMEFEAEVRTLFREFARANPTAGVQELDGSRFIIGLQRNDARIVREFALLLTGQPVLADAFRKLAAAL